MKFTAKLLSIFVFLICSGFYLPFSLAQTEDSMALAQSDARGYDSFLRRMGLEDFSAQLRESIAQENFLNKHVSRRVLEYQSERLEMYNSVRTLAVEILNTLHTNNRGPESRDKIIEFATRLLNTKPYRPTLPKYLENDPDGATKHIMERTRENIEVQPEVLMADLIHVLYGEKNISSVLDQLESSSSSNPLSKDLETEVARLGQLQKKVNHIVQFMYLDNEMGGFSVTALGKALVLGMTRYQILKDRAGASSLDLIAKMKASLKKVGMHYENYVGTKLIVDTVDGKQYSVEIRNGDHLFERSFGQQANEITAGGRPSGIRNWIYAARLGLLGSIIGRNFHNENDEVTAKPGFWERVKKKLRESAMFTNGVSHAGIAEVLIDPETGIRTTRSIDSYVDDKEGGLRFTDILHQFARKSEYLRLIVARPDSKKLAKYAQDFVKKVGYQEVVWMGDRENKDGTIHSKESVPWTPNISREDFEKLHALAAKNPTAYSEEIARRVVHGMKDLFYKGASFAAKFNNSYGRVYCTFAMFISYLRETGLDPQPIRDRWNYIVQVAKKMNLPQLEKFNMAIRLISPVGMLAQKDLYELNDIQVVNYGNAQLKTMIEEGFSEPATAMDPNLHRRLRTYGRFVKGTQVGAKHAAEETLLVGRIENGITINRDYENGKLDENSQRGRAQSSYLQQARAIIDRTQHSTGATPNQTPALKQYKKSTPQVHQPELSCKQVFKK